MNNLEIMARIITSPDLLDSEQGLGHFLDTLGMEAGRLTSLKAHLAKHHGKLRASAALLTKRRYQDVTANLPLALRVLGEEALEKLWKQFNASSDISEVPKNPLLETAEFAKGLWGNLGLSEQCRTVFRYEAIKADLLYDLTQENQADLLSTKYVVFETGQWLMDLILEQAIGATDQRVTLFIFQDLNKRTVITWRLSTEDCAKVINALKTPQRTSEHETFLKQNGLIRTTRD